MERIPRLVSRCREKSPAPTLRAIDPRGVLGFKAVCAKRSAATATLFAQGTTITMESSLQQPLRRLPFAFAKRHGVLLDGSRLQARYDASLNALQEAQRFAGQVLPCQWLAPGDFEQALGAAYQHDSSAAMQMVEGLGADMDLASLAEQVPETEARAQVAWNTLAKLLRR